MREKLMGGDEEEGKGECRGKDVSAAGTLEVVWRSIKQNREGGYEGGICRIRMWVAA